MTVGIETGIGCNFCNRGVVVGGTRLGYPYEFVYTIERTHGASIKATICEDCIKELITKTMTQPNEKTNESTKRYQPGA